MSIKRKRGANYTPQETEKLLELVKQHRSAIEDKRTGYVHLTRKKEAWDKVCAAYNAVATSGTRSVDHLRVFYDNKKQKARKALATHNKSEYMQHHVTDEEVKEAIQHVKVDKGQYNKTGGGTWHPAVTDHDLKILNLVRDQVTPLPNSCDSAAVYFGDDYTRECEPQGILQQEVIIDMNDDYFVKQNQENNDLSEQIASKHNVSGGGQKEGNEIDTHVTKQTARRYKKKDASLHKKKCQVNYKALYFKRKSQNALLERRRLYQEIRLKQKEHSLVLKEHQLRMQFLKEEHEKRMQEM